MKRVLFVKALVLLNLWDSQFPPLGVSSWVPPLGDWPRIDISKWHSLFFLCIFTNFFGHLQQQFSHTHRHTNKRELRMYHRPPLIYVWNLTPENCLYVNDPCRILWFLMKAKPKTKKKFFSRHIMIWDRSLGTFFWNLLELGKSF